MTWSRSVAASVTLAGSFLVAPLSTSDADAQGVPACTITGTFRADVLRGTAGDDVICGLGGDDRLVGGRGDDVLFGGDGRDVLLGGSGHDLLRGGPHRDVMHGGSGDDSVRGGAGGDMVQGGAGADWLRGSQGGDRLSGGPGRDVVAYMPRAAPLRLSIGDGANDGARGERDDIAADVEDLRGGSGNDILIGSARRNRLFGLSGNDRVVGGGGHDVITGGSGTDVIDGRDGAGFVDELRCGAGAGDQALADMTDTIAGGCEVVVQNDPPTAVSLAPASVEENEPVGTLVGTLTAADPDAGDRHTYSLVAGTGAANNGSFTIAGTQLRTRAVFDFETKGSYTIRVRATDTEGSRVDQPLTITVVDADEPPVAVDDTAIVAEDAPETPIDVLANDTDVDDGPMVIDAVSQPANGMVTDGGDDLAYEPVANFCGADTFTYTLNGGSIGTVTVTVTCVDDLPVAVNDTATVTEDDPAATLDVLANDVDPEDDPITITTVTQPVNGTVVITIDGDDVTYEPDPDYCGTDTFTYTINGGDTATVNVTVTCVNDPPIAVDDTFTTDEDTDLELPPSGPESPAENDTDVDGDPLTVTEVSDPAGGTVTLAAGTVTFTPTADLCGAATGGFTYTVSDGNGGTDAGQVTVDITCVDDPPVAVNDTATVSEDAAATAVDVLANDTDIDGGPKTITAASDPANGTVVLTGGTPGAHAGLTYQPDPNYCNNPPGTAPDTFTYTLNGGDSATVAVTVTCVDDAPVAVTDTATVNEDSGASTIDVLANDVDADSVGLTIDTVTQPADGTVVITNDGDDLTYQPDANYCNNPPGTTPDTFTYTLNGGSIGTVSVTVNCVDDAPVAVNDSATVLEDAAVTGVDVLANDTDIDGGPKTITAASDPASGTVVLTGGSPGAHTGLTYQPDPNYCNNPPGTTPDTFTYTLNGGSIGTVVVTVTCVDDPPVAVNDTATVLEDAAATGVDVLANDTDIDGGPKTFTAASDPASGTVVLTGGSPGAHTGLTYQPDPNYCNNPPGTTPDTFTYTLNGGSIGTVAVTVTCVNDPPVADDESFTGANGAVGNTAFVVDDPDDAAPVVAGPKKTITGDLLAGDSDIDGPGPLVIQAGAFTTNDGGSVTIQADGDFVFTPAAGTSCTDTGDFFDYTVSDQNPGTAGTDTGRVAISLAGCVWYVSNNVAGNAGTSTAPFDTLAQADTATPAGDVIFVFDGDNTTTGYTAGIDLAPNQRLIGEAADLVVGGTTLHTGVAANRPTITDNNADVVDLAAGNTVTGLDIDPQGAGGGIAGSTGDNGGTITGVNIVDTAPLGSQPGLELDGTTGTFNISGLAVTTNGASGIRLNNAGTVNFASAGTITITTTGGKALDATGATTNFGTSSVIDDLTVTGSSTGAVNLSATTGNLTLGDGSGTDLALTTTSGATAALASAHAGTLTVNPFGTDNLSATGGPALDITGSGTFDFDDVDSTNSSTDGINLDLTGASTFTATSGDITGAAGIAFDLNGGSGNVTYPGAIGNGTGNSVEVTGRSGGTVTLSGQINDSNDAGGGITVTGNTGGTTTFSNAVKNLNTGASDAIAFTTSNGHTLNLTGGGLDIDTTSGRGIHANDAGTITIAGTNNTITSTTGTALGVTTTDIGATGATFQSVSANGAANGIVLNTTGTAGNLVVTGDGDGNPDGGGGTVQNTTSHGLNLSNTLSPSLTDVSVTNAGDADNEYGLLLTNVSGTVTLDDMSFNNAADNLVYLTSTSSSTVNVTGSAFTYPAVIGPTANSAILLEPGAAANLTASITGSTFTDIVSASTQIGANTAGANGTLSLTFSNNTVNSSAGRAGGVVVSGQESTTTALAIATNTFNGAGGNGVISIDTNDASTVTGTISNNAINNPPGIGIFSAVDEDATSTLTFNANTITNAGGDGIQLVNFGSPTQPSLTSEMNATVTNNTVNGHSLNSAVSFVGGISVTGFEEVMDLQLTGNTVTGTPTDPVRCGGAPCVDYYLEEVAGTFRLEEIPDTPATSANAAYVNSTNDTGPVTIFGVIDLSNGVEISSS